MRPIRRGDAPQQSWYDTMQVCLRGHQITTALKSSPATGSRFCSDCGEATISTCLTCHTEIPGYYHCGAFLNGDIPVPARCKNCGQAFPWAISDEAKSLCALVKDAVPLAHPDRNASVWSLTKRVRGRVGARADGAAGRCDLLWSFAYALHQLYSEPRPVPPDELKWAESTVTSFLHALAFNVKELQVFLGHPLGDKEVIADYGNLRDAFNKVVADHSSFRAKLGMSPIGLERAEVFTELPKWSPVDEKTYSRGSNYDVYNDVKGLVSAARKEVFIVEPYPNEEIFNLYLEKVGPGVSMRVLVSKHDATFDTVAQKFAAKAGVQVGVRALAKLHDRTFFVDDRCWTLGQSLKDAGKDKPTYLTQIESPEWRRIHDDLWKTGTKIA